MPKYEEDAVCAWEECEAHFVRAVHNQIYCSPECCRLATNKRLIEQYHLKKAGRKKHKRVCSRKNCDTILSQYNKESICELCQTERFKKRLIKWGWDLEGLEL